MFISQHWWAVYRRRSAAEATLAALLAYTSALQQAQQDGPSLEQLHCCWNSGNFGVISALSRIIFVTAIKFDCLTFCPPLITIVMSMGTAGNFHKFHT